MWYFTVGLPGPQVMLLRPKDIKIIVCCFSFSAWIAWNNVIPVLQLSAILFAKCETRCVAYPEIWQQDIWKRLRVCSWDCCKPPWCSYTSTSCCRQSLERDLPQAVPECPGETQSSPKPALRVKQHGWAEIQSSSLVPGSLQHCAGTILTVLVHIYKSWLCVRSGHGPGTLWVGSMAAAIQYGGVRGFCLAAVSQLASVPAQSQTHLIYCCWL